MGALLAEIHLEVSRSTVALNARASSLAYPDGSDFIWHEVTPLYKSKV